MGIQEMLLIVAMGIYCKLKLNKSSYLFVGTWQDAAWAIQFYEKFGFIRHTKKQTAQLLNKYWEISSKQIENSVVLEKYTPL